MDEKAENESGQVAKKFKTSESSDKSENYLSSKALIYDVLSVIFKYLNGKDLCTAGMVCRSWREAANDEKRTRGPAYFSASISCPIPKSGLRKEWITTELISGKELQIKPKLALVFIPTFPIDTMSEDKACHCEQFPRVCNTIILSADGIVENKEEYEQNTQKTVSMLLPETPGIRIKTYVFSRCETKESFKSKIQLLRNVFIDTAPKKEGGTSNCLLLFSNSQCKEATGILYHLRQWYPKKVISVWGGIVNHLHICKTGRKERLCCKSVSTVAVALSGPGIQTWSIIIDRKCRTKTDVEEKLKSFKQHIRLKRHSVGLMFACCARGEEYYRERNVESSVFKSLFPSVPLLGCFGGGEFGENTVPDEPRTKSLKQYTTIFMILTYGQ